MPGMPAPGGWGRRVVNLKTCCVHNEFHKASWGPQLTCYHTCTPKNKKGGGGDGWGRRKRERNEKKDEEAWGGRRKQRRSWKKTGRGGGEHCNSPPPLHPATHHPWLKHPKSSVRPGFSNQNGHRDLCRAGSCGFWVPSNFLIAKYSGWSGNFPLPWLLQRSNSWRWED